MTRFLRLAIYFAVLTGFASSSSAQGLNLTLIHYWNFNGLLTAYHNPGIPPLAADYSILDTSKAKFVYVLTAKNQSYAGYFDNVAGDTTNARMGAPAGQSLRLRNPSDSMEMRFYIPTTGYSNITLKWEVESSSVGSGQKTQLFDYSVDSGVTWKTTGLNITSEDITQTIFQGSSWGLITVNFGTDSTVDNNPKMVFRIKFSGNTSLTSGNNRFDNVTVEGVYVPPPVPLTLIHYWNFNGFNNAYHNPGIPPIAADYSIIDTSKAKIVYQLDASNQNYIGYWDNVAGDTTNSRLGAAAGQAMRLRNPSDSMELRFYVPTTNYSNIVLKYEVESSSVGSGQKTQLFDYSVDSGVTWKTTGLNITSEDITQAVFQGSSWGLITINFGTDTTVNNNRKLVFRVKFAGNTSLTSGNNRFDNVTVEGTYSGPLILRTLVHYWNFNKNLLTNYNNPSIPSIPADYSAIDTSKAKIVYKLNALSPNYAGFIDNPIGDTINSRQGAGAGVALRVDNPSDSMELRLYIPTTNYSNVLLQFEVHSTGILTGQKAQNYDYSTDSGTTWRTGNLNIVIDSITQSSYQGRNWGLVSVNFGTDTTVNNNPRLVFRIRFGGNTTLITGGNLIDNVTVDGTYKAPPPPPPLPLPTTLTLLSPAAGSVLTGETTTTIKVTTTGAVVLQLYVQYSTNGGLSWMPITTMFNDTSFVWTVPQIQSSNCLIRVSDPNGISAMNMITIDSALPGGPVVLSLIQYWNFNTLTQAFNNPNIPALPADFTAPTLTTGQCVYVLDDPNDPTYAGYIDNVAGDTTNARLGAPAGNGLRVRNPSDSMELRWYIPTTGYNTISAKYALQSSSTTSGQLTEIFDYSIDSGKTWQTSGLTVNGLSTDSLDVTQAQYQQKVGFGLVTLTFGSTTSVNNNPRLILRIKFGANASMTSGNNRFDNFSIEGYSNGPIIIPPTITVTSPKLFDTLIAGQQKLISFTNTGTLTASRTIAYSTNGGTTWLNVGIIDSTSSYNWIVPNTPSTNALIRVTDANGVTATSPRFYIIGLGVVADFTVPTIAGVVTAGTEEEISWTASGYLGSTVNIDISYDGQATWRPVKDGYTFGTDTVYDWIVPDTVSKRGIMRLTFAGGAVGLSNPFSIEAVEGVTSNESASTTSVWPNPVANTGRISYYLQATTPVTLSICDLLGREFSRVAQGEERAGMHQLSFDVARLPEGTYIYTLLAGSAIHHGKIIVAR